jgi:hypothetical protein
MLSLLNVFIGLTLVVSSFATYSKGPNCNFIFLVNFQTNNVYREFAPIVPGYSTATYDNTRDGFYFFDGFKRELDGKTVGEVHYRFTEKTKGLFIADMHVSLKKKHISLILLADIIKRHPGTARIRTTIGLDNYKIFQEAYGKTSSLEEAIKATPAYKIRKRLGFSKIEKDSIDYDPEDNSLIFSVLLDQ